MTVIATLICVGGPQEAINELRNTQSNTVTSSVNCTGIVSALYCRLRSSQLPNDIQVDAVINSLARSPQRGRRNGTSLKLFFKPLIKDPSEWEQIG